MRDQSFSKTSLLNLINDKDRLDYPYLAEQEETIAGDASLIAEGLFESANPLESLHVQKKKVFRPSSFAHELIIRKLNENIKHSFHATTRGRRFIVKTLVSHLSEGLPYRLYKRDIYHFYESFHSSEVQKSIESAEHISRLTKRLLQKTLDGHEQLGGVGLPRGLGLSATLSEFMMRAFDESFHRDPEVRYYARYVDDIVIITNGTECSSKFSKRLSEHLPRGLRFNSLKTAIQDSDPPVPLPSGHMININYLGYSIAVLPASSEEKDKLGRTVLVDISTAKTKKIKTRIVRALLSHTAEPNFALLAQRIRFLSANTSLPVQGQSVRRLIGIHHTYPLLTSQKPCQLDDLDSFLRQAILTRSGRIGSRLSLLLTKREKDTLLSNSFRHGHTTKRFMKLYRHQLFALRRCWINE